MQKYKHWDILDELPDGWVIDKTAGSPAPNTVFITNGKSVLKGQKRALLKVEAKIKNVNTDNSKVLTHATAINDSDNYLFPAKSVNMLARLKFKKLLLQEITFDLTVCEIEGWNKKEYIRELKKLINGIDSTNKKRKETATLALDFLNPPPTLTKTTRYEKDKISR